MPRATLPALACATLTLLLTSCAPTSPLAPVATPTVPTAPPSVTEQAIDLCQDLVRTHLKAPATAQFPPPPEPGSATATPNDSTSPNAGPWAITGSVDSENSYGALLRSVYACTVTRNPADATSGTPYLEATLAFLE